MICISHFLNQGLGTAKAVPFLFCLLQDYTLENKILRGQKKLKKFDLPVAKVDNMLYNIIVIKSELHADYNMQYQKGTL